MIVKSRWFDAGDGRFISYDTAQEIAAFLFEHLDLVPDWNAVMHSQANLYAAWRDFKGMRLTFEEVVDVHAELARLGGHCYLDNES